MDAERRCSSGVVTDGRMSSSDEVLVQMKTYLLPGGAKKWYGVLIPPGHSKLPETDEDITIQFVQLCVLCGCDYCPSVPGVGIVTAYKLVNTHKKPVEVRMEPRTWPRFHDI